MATEVQKMIVRNIDRDSLLLAISERDDIIEIMKLFRENRDYEQREYMTVSEFSKYLKVSEAYVRDLAKRAEARNLFSVVRIGREYRLDRLSYEKFIKQGGLKECF